MNILLWVLQAFAALLYAASGVMKVFMFDTVSEGVQSFGALPRNVWTMLLHWHPALTVVAATVLAIESLVFIAVHVKYRETVPIIMSVVLGLLVTFIAVGRVG